MSEFKATLISKGYDEDSYYYKEAVSTAEWLSQRDILNCISFEIDLSVVDQMWLAWELGKLKDAKYLGGSPRNHIHYYLVETEDATYKCALKEYATRNGSAINVYTEKVDTSEEIKKAFSSRAKAAMRHGKMPWKVAKIIASLTENVKEADVLAEKLIVKSVPKGLNVEGILHELEDCGINRRVSAIEQVIGIDAVGLLGIRTYQGRSSDVASFLATQIRRMSRKK